jgi:hypothetical protein
MDESFDLDSPLHSPLRNAQTVPIGAEADDAAATATQVDATASAAASTAASTAVPATLSSLGSAIAALAAGLDEQQAHLSAASSDLSAHFAQQSSSSSSLPAHRRPDALLARLHALSSMRLPALAKRQAALTEAQRPVLQEVERLMAANRVLLADMHARVGTSSSSNSNIHASSTFATPATDALLATIPVATPSKASPSALLSARSSAAAPPVLSLPSAAAAAPATATPAAAATTSATTRRKSARPLNPAPPSPRDSSAAALLSEVVEEGPVSDREFAGVSSTVKSRVKLAEVNQLLGVIQNHFARIVANQAALSVGSSSHHGGRKSIGGAAAAAAAVAAAAASIDPASLPPLTLTTLSELGGAGKIGGATSQCIIGTLRACKRILVDRRGILLVKLPPPYSASAAAIASAAK